MEEWRGGGRRNEGERERERERPKRDICQLFMTDKGKGVKLVVGWEGCYSAMGLKAVVSDIETETINDDEKNPLLY